MSADNQPLQSRLAGAPTLQSEFAALAEAHKHDRDVATEDLRYFIDRRDKLTERIRFGLLTLNGASLLALLTALGGSGEAAKWLGFTRETAIISAASFTIGLLLAGCTIWAQQNWYAREAGDGAQRAITLAGVASRYQLPATEGNVRGLKEDLERIEKLPTVGFQFSGFAIWAQNTAQGAWLFGILTPLLSTLFTRAM